MTTDTTAATAREDELDLLACCLSGYDPRHLNLNPADFDEPKHAAVWRAMQDIADSGNAVSPASVRLALGAEGDRSAVWLLDVFARPVVPGNAPALAARVARTARLRDLQDLARGLMQRAGSDDADPTQVVGWAREKLDAPTGVVRETVTVGEVLPEVVRQIEQGTQSGRSTPWPDLDRRIHGLADDRLYIVAARPGVGKSLLGQNLAWHWSSKHRLPTYFASLEMTAGELTTRLVAQTAEVEMDALLSGRMTDQHWAKVSGATPRLSESRIHIADDTTQTVDMIRQGARQLQRRQGLGLVIVDYLQLVTPRDRRIPREQQVSEISRGLKLLAKELHVPVVAMAQLRRQHEGEKARKPTLSDLRESGAIEQDADAVLLLHIPDESMPWDAELYVAKARAGSKGDVELAMATHYAQIRSVARSAA